MGASVASSKRASVLKATALVRIRPSTSGSATFMAMSRGERPRVASAHCRSVAPAKIACNTGTPAWAKGVSCGAPGRETAKPVAFRTIRGSAARMSAPISSAAGLSLRLVTKMGSGFEACVLERRNQRIHGRERASLQQRPIEDHARRSAQPVAPMGCITSSSASTPAPGQ